MGRKIALIVDSDIGHRRWLRECTPKSFALWECESGGEAVRYINSLQPDLVLMNVNVPSKNAFEVLDSVDHLPGVIFMSDHVQDAARAFEYQAIDYLVKPFSSARFLHALQRFEKSIESKRSIGTLYPNRIFVERGNRLISRSIAEVTHLKADKDYTWIHMKNGESYLSNLGIGHVERKLNPQIFIRIHRSYIVNLDFVMEMYRDAQRSFVTLVNGVEINVGRNYRSAIKELIF
ncbi:LytR/AlgR family response regulator transcription factor [Leadbetterella byssophila]|uniref:LytR/AlgR family response regulator transcription factor n=1 Tax=Leadbetterella byssophila TaxID=316068 RepID=UPI00399F0D10